MNNDNSGGDSRDAFSSSSLRYGGAFFHPEPFVSVHPSQDVSTVLYYYSLYYYTRIINSPPTYQMELLFND
jgi:hypothetical protein